MTSSELLQKSTNHNNDLYKTKSLVEKELDDNLIISFFDQIIGPRLFYCSNRECFEDFDLFSFLDVLEPGTFIFAFKKFHTINHIFTIDSEHARGFKEIIMLTYMIRNIDIEDTYRYLKSKTLVLEALAKDIKELKEFQNILSRKNKPDNILELGSEEFRNCFLDTYDKYCNVSSKFKILNPVNELKPQDIDTYSIKIHIKPAELSRILNAFLFNRKVAFWIRKESKLKQKILDFFKFIFQDSFKIDISVKPKKIFNKNKNLIVWWEKKAYNENKLKHLIELVKGFYAEPDSISAIINLRDKIRETYVLTKRIYEIAGILEKKPIFLHRKPITRQLEDSFYVKLKRNQILYLKEIVKNYFGLDIRWHQEQVAEKIEQNWGS